MAPNSINKTKKKKKKKNQTNKCIFIVIEWNGDNFLQNNTGRLSDDQQTTNAEYLYYINKLYYRYFRVLFYLDALPNK